MATTISLFVSFDIAQLNRIPALRWWGQSARNFQFRGELFRSIPPPNWVEPSARNRPAESPRQIIRERRLVRERLAPGFQLSLHDSELRENAIPLRFQPTHFFV